jgi:GntR family transcriptional regulator/MocR family aminotransferase
MGSAAARVTDIRTIPLNRNSTVPLYRQLESGLRDAVAAGALAPGERVPPIQELAIHFQLSRNTVRRAYQNLAAEGLLEGTAESGFRVRRPKAELPPVAAARSIAFDRGSVLDRIEIERLGAGGLLRPFCPGFPETNEFPFKIWEALRAEVLKERAAELLSDRSPLGYFPLREAIANRLRGARGVACAAEQVIVSAGGRQALHLVFETLLSPGDAVGIEEPGCYAAKAAAQWAGAHVFPLLVDEEGLAPPDPRRSNLPALIYVTPANQFPLGVKLSPARRTALLDFAHSNGAWILEADAGAEFGYSSQRPSSLQGADDHSRVLYLGDLENTLFPALEIEYLVVPPPLVDRFAKSKTLLGALPSAIDQAVLERFLRCGHLDEHVRRMNALYYRRLQALAESVDSELRDFVELEPADGGLHAVGWLKRGVDEQAVANCAAAAGVELPLLSSFGRTALVRPGVVFGFAAFSERQIRSAVRKLARALLGTTRPRFLDRLVRRPPQIHPLP